MNYVSSDGYSVQYLSRRGILRTYTSAQWAMIWPKLINAMFQ